MEDNFKNGDKEAEEIYKRIKKYMDTSPNEKGKQIGVKINPVIWKSFRLQCMLMGYTATDTLNELMQNFVNSKGGK